MATANPSVINFFVYMLVTPIIQVYFSDPETSKEKLFRFGGERLALSEIEDEGQIETRW
jgi:hypothetical protein